MSGISDSEDEMELIRRTFAPLVGKPAWFVKKGWASCLTFEFGEPQLVIREPFAASRVAQMRPESRRRAARREIYVKGRWHLWIHMCNWKCTENGIEIGQSESPDIVIKSVANFLDGQCLVSVDVDRNTKTTIFTFDLGGVLETYPYEFDGSEMDWRDGEDPISFDWDKTDEDQWMLFVPDENVLVLYADGHMKFGSRFAK